MIDTSEWSDYLKIGAALGAFFYVGLRGRGWIKTKSSEDGVVVAESGARIDMLKRALDVADAERARADLAFNQRNEALSKIGRFEAQVESLQVLHADCERRLADMEVRLQALQTIVDRRLATRD